MEVHRGTQRGKPVLRILTADYGRHVFRGINTPYAPGKFPPDTESRARFESWAIINGHKPRKLARIIALGLSTGKVSQDRSDMLIRALRRGFHL